MKKEEEEKEGGGKEERVKGRSAGGCGDRLRYGVEEKERREEKKILAKSSLTYSITLYKTQLQGTTTLDKCFIKYSGKRSI